MAVQDSKIIGNDSGGGPILFIRLATPDLPSAGGLAPPKLVRVSAFDVRFFCDLCALSRLNFRSISVNQRLKSVSSFAVLRFLLVKKIISRSHISHRSWHGFSFAPESNLHSHLRQSRLPRRSSERRRAFIRGSSVIRVFPSSILHPRMLSCFVSFVPSVLEIGFRSCISRRSPSWLFLCAFAALRLCVEPPGPIRAGDRLSSPRSGWERLAPTPSLFLCSLCSLVAKHSAPLRLNPAFLKQLYTCCLTSFLPQARVSRGRRSVVR